MHHGRDDFLFLPLVFFSIYRRKRGEKEVTNFGEKIGRQGNCGA